MKTLPHDHGQKFEQMREQIPGPEAFQIVADLLTNGRSEPGADLLAALPLRRMCHQYLFPYGNEQSGSLPSSQATENDRTDHQPPGW